MRTRKFTLTTRDGWMKKWHVIVYGSHLLSRIVIRKKVVGESFEYTIYPNVFEKRTVWNKIKFFFFRIIVFLRII